MICSVCIATYRRPELLEKLLASIEAQVLSEITRLEVIVVDNDREGSAAPAVSKRSDSDRIVFRYFQQPVKNISITRNVAVANATGEYLLFIDDDEVAAPDWAEALVRIAREYSAGAVFGPVFPVFDDSAPDWLRKGASRLAGTMPCTATGTEAVGTWTCNSLVKADLVRNLSGPFNPEYGITGGEDTELFNRLRRSGVRLIYGNEARVFEYWPPSRARVSYLLIRGLKGGNSHTRRTIAFAERKQFVRLFMFAKAMSFGAVSLALSLLASPSAFWRTYWQMKVAANVGRFMAAMGHNYRGYS